MLVTLTVAQVLLGLRQFGVGTDTHNSDAGDRHPIFQHLVVRILAVNR